MSENPLVERLREPRPILMMLPDKRDVLAMEAADAIECLEHDLTRSMEATAQYLNEAERLTVERDRLRAALQEIADGHFFGSEEMLFARAALAEPGEKG